MWIINLKQKHNTKYNIFFNKIVTTSWYIYIYIKLTIELLTGKKCPKIVTIKQAPLYYIAKQYKAK